MCNEIKNAKPMRKTGLGWKIFSSRNGVEMLTLVWEQHYYNSVYQQLPYQNPSGFCFFPTKKEALLAFKLWPKGVRGSAQVRGGISHHLKRIRYHDGMRRKEDHFTGSRSWDIGLCQSFEILPDPGTAQAVERLAPTERSVPAEAEGGM